MLIGSHYDTVIDGGMFDGALGIITGIAAVKALVLEAAVKAGVITPQQLEDVVANLAPNATTAQGGGPAGAGNQRTLDVERLYQQYLKDAPRPLLPRPVQIAAFSDEEGVRFQSTFLGSKALAGSLVSSGVLDVRDSQGISLLEALQAKGLADTAEDVQAIALEPGALAGYVEVHLEQGPVLEEAGAAMGVVTAIAGQSRILVSMKGQQGHAGTVPMRLRHDSLSGAAELIVDIERICRSASLGEKPGDLGKILKDAGVKLGADPSLVCTVGAAEIWPGASNVIPGAANFTLDVRSQSDSSRATVLQAMRSTMEAICTRRGLQCTLEVRHQADAVLSNSAITEALARAVGDDFKDVVAAGAAGAAAPQSCPAPADENSANSEQGKKAKNGKEVLRLMSGAGHDAMAMAEIAPMGMMFVRCAKGISHSPEEWVAPEDVASAAAALLHFLRSWQQDRWDV